MYLDRLFHSGKDIDWGVVGTGIRSADEEIRLKIRVDPAIRIVLLTVTKGGYHINPETGRFDSSHPDITRDGVGDYAPRTVFGLITEELHRRRASETIHFPCFRVAMCRGTGKRPRMPYREWPNSSISDSKRGS